MNRTIVIVAVLMVVAAGSLWADSFGLGGDSYAVLTGSYLEIGLNTTRGTFGTDAGGGVLGVGFLFDPLGGGSFAGKPDFLQADASGNHFGFYSMNTDQTGLKAVAANGGVFTDTLSMSLTSSSFISGVYTYTWQAAPIPVAGGFIDYTRTFRWNTLLPRFTITTTIANDFDNDFGMTGITYAEGLDPNQNEPTSANTINSTSLGGFDSVFAQGDAASNWVVIQLRGAGGATLPSNPTVQTTNVVNSATLYSDALGANHLPLGDGTINLALSSADKAPGGSASDTITYLFAQGQAPTPELGTFALMGLSMLPMAGLALRRRRKSA